MEQLSFDFGDSLREITLPRPNRRPPYVTKVNASAIRFRAEALGEKAVFTIELTDEQIAEYSEIFIGGLA